jgi:hypothetical protein
MTDRPPLPITPEIAAEWGDRLADVIWWLHGFKAAAKRRDAANLPDVGELRRMRDDIDRMARGLPPIERIEPL